MSEAERASRRSCLSSRLRSRVFRVSSCAELTHYIRLFFANVNALFAERLIFFAPHEADSEVRTMGERATHGQLLGSSARGVEFHSAQVRGFYRAIFEISLTPAQHKAAELMPDVLCSRRQRLCMDRCGRLDLLLDVRCLIVYLMTCTVKYNLP